MKSNKGITMISLITTIILLLILVGISIGSGNNIIKQSNLENLKTNMLLIKVKGKEYVENSNFKLGTNIDTATDKEIRITNAKSELKGEEITNTSIFSKNINITQENLITDNSNYIYYYKLEKQHLEDMGMPNIESDGKNGWYIIKYDLKNAQIEVYNTKGFEKEEKIYYSLSEIQNLEI